MLFADIAVKDAGHFHPRPGRRIQFGFVLHEGPNPVSTGSSRYTWRRRPNPDTGSLPVFFEPAAAVGDFREVADELPMLGREARGTRLGPQRSQLGHWHAAPQNRD